VTEQEQQQLLNLAEQSIRHGLAGHGPLSPRKEGLPATLLKPGACFVTLHSHGQLRGCIGSLSAHRALYEDVVENAWAAAFRDPRFPPLQAEEITGLELHISILGEAEALVCHNEAELLAQLRPNIDGLILEQGPYRATFLPSVWEQLPQPELFLQQLRRKAGLPAEAWSAQQRFSRYQCESFGSTL
jgi:AmmeMemoRadiSam system protein A